MDTNNATAVKTSNVKARIALSILVAVHLAVCAFIALAAGLFDSVYWRGIVLGLLFAQCSLLAVWAALGPQKIIRRVLIALFLLGFLALAISNLYIEDVGSITYAMLLAGILVLQWLVIQAPLWAIRLIWKAQLVWPGQEALPPLRDELKFSLMQIMIWTAAVAVLLGVGRFIFSTVKIGDFSLSGFTSELDDFMVLLFFNGLIALFTIYGALSRWKPLVCFFLCLVAVFIAGIGEAFVFAVVQSGSPEIERCLSIFLPMTMAHFALLSANLLLLRWCGFRLTRVGAE